MNPFNDIETWQTLLCLSEGRQLNQIAHENEISLAALIRRIRTIENTWGVKLLSTIDFLPSINEEDSCRFSDSRSLMSKLPRRVSASAGLPKGVQLGFCTFSKRSFTCLDTTVYSFRSHISPQTSLRDSPPLDLKR